MASVMLATYPELFAAGAIIAGIPYGCANWVTDARSCMSGAARVPVTDLASFVLRASAHKGPWPRISVWHGLEDERVVPTNGTDIVRQWLAVHRLRARPHIVETIDGNPHRIWLIGPVSRSSSNMKSSAWGMGRRSGPAADRARRRETRPMCWMRQFPPPNGSRNFSIWWSLPTGESSGRRLPDGQTAAPRLNSAA